MHQEGFEQQEINDFVEAAYLDYAMYVILDRALPHIGDGLKPVQRRIIYAMSELHLNHLAKYKKSARTIGDVLGKFHPHGDTACYDAMVLMAQPFASRYPLIDGQGNFGTADDPKSFAAMRYTEAKLSKYAEILLEEIDKGAVVWVNNFDGTLKEPKILPAKLPMILLNGTTGIAVGMATDLVPHNLSEVAAACMYILDHVDPKNISIDELCNYITGPDFPTKAEIITNKADLLQLYKNGYGTIKVRAVYTKEKDSIIITALPYMVSGAKVLKQIADQIHNKNLQFITDLRDESNHDNPTRLILLLKSNRVDVEAIMSHLFATTELEKSYRVNFNMIGINGKPQVKNLLQILTEWLEFRISLVEARLNCSLSKIIDRLHILDGLLIAYLNLDEVIKIIRFEDEPKAVLIKKFKLSELQANAILDLKLKNLAKLEEIKIKEEASQLIKEKEQITAILSSKNKLKALVKKEIKAIAEKLSDDRNSNLQTRDEAKALDSNLLAKSSEFEVTVVISDKGWVRCGKGKDIDPKTLIYRSGEQYKAHDIGLSSQQVIFLDSTGKSYSLPAANLPNMRGYGEPLTSKLTPASGVLFEAVIMGDPQQKVLLVQNQGFGFVTTINNLKAKTKTGKNIINLNGGKLLTPVKLNLDLKYCLLLTSECKILMFNVALIPELNKGRGSKLCNISKKDSIIAVTLLAAHDNLVISYAKKQIIITNKELLGYLGNIGDRGFQLAKLPKDLVKKYHDIIIFASN